MGGVFSKADEKQIANNKGIDQNVINFIDFSFVGNIYEADKALKSIQALNVDEGTYAIMKYIERTTKRKIKVGSEKLGRTKQLAGEIIDLSQWEKKESVQEVFDHLRKQLSGMEQSLQELRQHKGKREENQDNSKLRAFLNIVWLGKYILDTFLCKRSQEVFNMSLHRPDALIPDVEIYEIVEDFHQLMRRVPSFMMIKKILDGQVAIQFLPQYYTHSQFGKSTDRFYGRSALRFENDMRFVTKRIVEIFKTWKEMYDQYLSKGCVELKKSNLKQKEQFYSYVEKLNKLMTSNDIDGVVQEKQQMSMNGVKGKPSSDESIVATLRQQNQLLKDQNKSLGLQLDDKEKEFRKVQLKLTQLQNAHKNCQSDLIAKDKRIKQLENQLSQVGNIPSTKDLEMRLKKQYEQKIKIFKQQWQNKQLKKIQEIPDLLSKFDNDVQTLLNERKNGSTIDSVMNNSRNYIEEIKIEELAPQINRTFKKLTKDIQKHMKAHHATIDESQREIAQLNAKLKSQFQINTSLQQNIDSLNRTKDSLKQEKSQLSELIKSQKIKYDTEIDRKKKEIQQNTKTLQRVQKDLSEKNAQVQKVKQELQEFQKKLKKDQNASKEEISQKQNQIRDLKRQLGNLNFQYTKKCQDIEKMTLSLKKVGRCYPQYFNGNILNIRQAEYVQWFVNSLEKCTRKQIRATYPLYRYDKENKSLFHNHIDNKPQIVMIVKMKTGQIIAGYSEQPFKPKNNVDYKQGFMFAFRNQKVFTLKKEPTTKTNKTLPKPFTYDEYFILWGNADIRIKTGTDELYSGYATANCAYEEKDNQNSTVNDLFLQEERDTFLEDYEFFQVEFENGENEW